MTEARRLNHDEIEERRKNLAFICENAALLESGDYLFTTTLLMQEQWLATVDALVAREGELVAALELFRLGDSGHFFGCVLFHKLDKECTTACASARAALAQGKKE